MSSHRIGGALLIATSLAFVAVFGYLAAVFGYPAVLDGSAEQVLPALLAGGTKLRLVWALYAFLPAGFGLSAWLSAPLLRRGGAGWVQVGLIAALVAAAAMTAGLSRWPTLQHGLAERFSVADASERLELARRFDAANFWLGRVTGELIGEVAMSLWFLTTSVAVLRGAGPSRWVGYLGLVSTASMLLAALRNLTSVVAPIAQLNNSLLPIWLIVLGGALWGTKAPRAASASAPGGLSEVG